MENKMNLNSVKQYAEGNVIFTKGEKCNRIGLIVKGKVMMKNDLYTYQYKAGDIIGFTELDGVYQGKYIAFEDVVLCEYDALDAEELDEFLSLNQRYRGLFVTSVAKELSFLYIIYERLTKDMIRLPDTIRSIFKEYLEFCNTNGYECKPSEIPEICNIEIAGLSDPMVKTIKSYLFLADITMDVAKAYYERAGEMACTQINEMLISLTNLRKQLPEFVSLVSKQIGCFINHTDDCLYRRIALLALQIEQAGGANENFIDHLDDIMRLLHEEELFFQKYLTEKLVIDRKSMGELYSTLITCLKNQDKSLVKKLYEMTKDHEEIIKSLSGSFELITGYAEYDEEKTKVFKQVMVKYVNLKDKNATDDASRELRRMICDHFYALYEKVFLKAFTQERVPRVIELFLDFGMLDERLLTKDQLLFLFNYKRPQNETGLNIYTIREWLGLVYTGEKEPSKNEFDLEYKDMLAELVKSRKLKESEVESALKSGATKVHYEIINLFRYNQKLLYGQVSTFVPVLCKDALLQDISKLMLTSIDISDKLNQVMGVDYSVFYQEVMYTAPEQGITKEYIMKQVLPDIILLPSYGVNGSMWQETSSRKRDTPARFILPRFTDKDLYDIFLKLCGRYRWEICRRLQGGAWNNIQYKSLTSEYMDYLQFYKKNRDLTEEKKDSIKLQLQKARNNAREVFVFDYEAWMRFESKGGLRLNKLAREMFATYCPFSKATRELLLKQPMYQDAMSRYMREKLKKAKELENHILMMEKNKIEVPREILDTLVFYKEN